MQIKKFSGCSLKEATENMKCELGVEAVILSSRMVQSLPGQKLYEITAGIEDDFDRNPAVEKKSISVNDYKEELARKIAKARELVKQTSFEPDRKHVLAEEPLSPQNDSSDIEKIIEALTGCELNKNVISSVVDELKKYQSFLHSSNIDNYVLSSLSSLIPVHNFSPKKGERPQTIALVGPTGVGKTTCIAKLAVISKIIHNLDVGIISIDTYRLGAIDQLRIFSEISNIDMLVAYEPEELIKQLELMKDKDIVFIDTAGRSQNNRKQLEETRLFLGMTEVDEIYLVMSSTSSERTLQETAEKFKLLKYNAAVFTKIDEAAAFGNIINIAADNNLPVAYLSNGQVIPDDIISADADFIANMVYRRKITK